MSSPAQAIVGTDLFKPKVLNFNLPKGNDPRAASFPLANKENSSLSLAARERFDVLCGDILWGSENRQEFGEMLRGLVITFLPETAFHLHLLRNVASCQWQLQRLAAIQANLFDQGKDTVGAFQLPAGTTSAMEFSASSSDLLRDLQRAIATYRSVKKQ